jgi:radical SAM superfamily enzyme with C-terminal helix-hairpin-helix motif
MGFRKGVILDGYVDEPTALGVPPYLSPYPRYVAGAFALAGVPYHYMTVDSWRHSPELQEATRADSQTLLVVISGLTVPGHYRGGTPITLPELTRVAESCAGRVLVGGPIRHGFTMTGGTTALEAQGLAGGNIVVGDLDEAVVRVLAGVDPGRPNRPLSAVAERAVAGASIVGQHPGFPHIICEIESARGCERLEHCSFCTEGLQEGLDFRSHEAIVGEVEALAANGTRHFRLGKQPNFFAWPGRRAENGVVAPDPEAIAALYRDIRRVAPELQTLHIDNVNPGFVASFPDECLDIARTISTYNTSGDVAAMGIESLDPAVVTRNRLKCSPQDSRKAIEIINRAGRGRRNRGLPDLLPGINLLYGLPGESAATYELNMAFLERLIEDDLLVRRINVRQVMVFPGTPLHDWSGGSQPKLNKGRFKRFKRRLFESVERPMLEQVAPVGTLLRGVVPEFRDGDVTFGRPLASYPLLVGIPFVLELGQPLDVIVVSHGFRSVTGLPWPLPVNSLPEKGWSAIPGVGQKRARRMRGGVPFGSLEHLLSSLDEPSVLAPFAGDFDFSDN